MVTVEAVGWIGTLTGTLLGLPQLVRLACTRNVEGLSLRTWQALLAVNVAWIQHGLRIGQPPQVITSVLSLCSTVPILLLMSRELDRPPLRVMLPGLLAAAGMITVDRAFGTAAYGIVAVIPAVLANAVQSIELVRAPRIVGVSPLFLLLAAVNQALWLTWALLVPDAGTAITAAVTGAGAAFNLGWWLARLAGLPPIFAHAQPRPAEGRSRPAATHEPDATGFDRYINGPTPGRCLDQQVGTAADVGQVRAGLTPYMQEFALVGTPQQVTEPLAEKVLPQGIGGLIVNRSFSGHVPGTVQAIGQALTPLVH